MLNSWSKTKKTNCFYTPRLFVLDTHMICKNDWLVTTVLRSSTEKKTVKELLLSRGKGLMSRVAIYQQKCIDVISWHQDEIVSG